MEDFRRAKRDNRKLRPMNALPEFIAIDAMGKARKDGETKKPGPGELSASRAFSWGAFHADHTYRPRRHRGSDDRATSCVPPAQGGPLTGMHHEVYLSASRRVTPGRMLTIIRHHSGTSRKPDTCLHGLSSSSPIFCGSRSPRPRPSPCSSSSSSGRRAGTSSYQRPPFSTAPRDNPIRRHAEGQGIAQ